MCVCINTYIWLPLWPSWYRICLQCGRPGFDPWVGKIPWRRERLPTPVFWPGEFLGLYSPWGCKELDMTEWLSFSLHFHIYIYYSAMNEIMPSAATWMDLEVIIVYEVSLTEKDKYHLIPRMRNLYAGQEATVRTGHGTTDWFQIGKGVHQGCILSPCLFNLCAEYIMTNAGLDEAQAGIKIARRNINNLRYADDTPLRQRVKRN